MNTPQDTVNTVPKERIVYVRPVNAEDLPEEIRAQADGSRFFSVHAPNGDRLAVVRDRKLAFLLARQNDYTPVNVH
jgi:hypothetical protein